MYLTLKNIIHHNFCIKRFHSKVNTWKKKNRYCVWIRFIYELVNENKHPLKFIESKQQVESFVVYRGYTLQPANVYTNNIIIGSKVNKPDNYLIKIRYIIICLLSIYLYLLFWYSCVCARAIHNQVYRTCDSEIARQSLNQIYYFYLLVLNYSLRTFKYIQEPPRGGGSHWSSKKLLTWFSD